MTQQQLDARSERAEHEVFVITATEEGWRVRSARNPGNHYTVTPTEESLSCSCPDFQNNVSDDPHWQCKHIIAVYNQRYTTAEHAAAELAASKSTPEATSEPSVPAATETANGHPAGQMLIKRSLSPDGRIDSISIEFSFALAEESSARIKARATKALKLQTEIVQGFLKNGDAKKNETTNGRKNGEPARETEAGVSGQLMDIGVMDGQYGERFYINVSVNGKRSRFFGNAAQLAKIISAAGRGVAASQIEPGFRINFPCRVLTEPSRDGKYLNVTKILPANGRNGGW